MKILESIGFKKISKRREIRHKVLSPDGSRYIYPDNQEPIKNNDVIKVYHGFRDHRDAINALIYGLSGKDRVSRTYSYENNNNPHGLFVTTNFDVAKNFVGSFGPGIIIEFNTKAHNLESPVWPGGSYTVQGEMEQYWKNNEERDKYISELRKKLTRDEYESISGSDKPELAKSIFDSSENQALFIGDLNPNEISSVWVNQENKVNSTYHRFSRTEFLKRFGKEIKQEKIEGRPNYNSRVFLPRDEWDEKIFIDKMISRYKGMWEDRESAKNSIIKGLSAYYKGGDRELLRYVWPNQLDGLKQFIIKNQ